MVGERQLGTTPEVRAEQRALKVRMEFEGAPDLVVINDRHRRFRQYMRFVDGSDKAESWMPKYDPDSGDVWITRWEDPTKIGVSSEDGKKVRVIEPPKRSSYATLVHPGHVRGEVDLSKIPLNWNVLKIIPQKHSNIESALRQQDVIRHDYGQEGPEFGRLVDITSAISLLTGKYIGGVVTEGNLHLLHSEVNRILTSNGLRTLRDETLAEISGQLDQATRRDSLARINPGRARFILSSAYVKAAKREVAVRKSGEKASEIYLTLLSQRAIERDNLAEAKRILDKLVGTSEGGLQVKDRIFDYEIPQHIPDHEITRFRQEELVKVERSLRLLRMNPYFLVARMASLLLSGISYRSGADFRLVTQQMDRAGMLKFLDYCKGNSVDSLIRRRDTYRARWTLEKVGTLIDACLQDDRLNDIKVFNAS